MLTREKVIEIAKEFPCINNHIEIDQDGYVIYTADELVSFAAACYRMGVESAGEPTYAGCTNAMAQSGLDTATDRGVENIDAYDVKAIYIACVSEITEDKP